MNHIVVPHSKAQKIQKNQNIFIIVTDPNIISMLCTYVDKYFQ